MPSLKYDVSGSNGWYPYHIDSHVNPGINAELNPQILARAGIKGVPVALPPKRTVLALKEGELDFDVSSPSWFDQGRVPPGYTFSAPLYEVTEYFVSAAGFRGWMHHGAGEEALHGAKIGTVRGYVYHNEHVFERVDFASEREIIMALQKGRVDYAIIGDLPARFWAERLGIEIQFGPVHSQGQVHLRFRDDKAHLLPEVNAAIQQMDSLGVILSVMNKYSPSDTLAFRQARIAP